MFWRGAFQTPRMPSHNGVPRSVHPQTWRYYKVDCALCGVNMTRDPPRQPRNGIYATLDPERDFFTGRERETQWLSHVRLLGNDPDSDVPYNVSLSERAQDDGHRQSSFNAEVGTTLLHYTAYHREEGEPYSVPFHEQCYELLRCYVGVPELDKEALHDACSGLSNDDDCSRRWTRLSIRYQGCDELDEESKRPFVHGNEHLAMSPITILHLEAYFARLPRLGDPGRPRGRQRTFAVTSDPFTRLSPEVLSMIMAEMTVLTLLKWRRASAMVANIPLSNRFWKRAIFKDMPWLTDISDPKSHEAAQDSIDWERVYQDLHVASKIENDFEIHGLSNRRRIWQEQCPIIANSYALVLANKNVGLRALMPQLEEVTVTRYSRLVEPAPVKTSVYTPTLLGAVAELTTIEPKLFILWTSIGTLAAIDTVRHGSMESEKHGYWEDSQTCEIKGHSDTVQIPVGDWVTGFSFFIRETRFKPQAPAQEMIEEVGEDMESAGEASREADSDEQPSPVPMSDDEEDAMDIEDEADPSSYQDEYADELDEFDQEWYTESEYSVDDDDDDEMMVGRQGNRSYNASWQDVDRRVIGIEIHLAKGDRIQLGRATEESRMVHVDGDKFVVGLSIIRRTSRGMVTQLNLIQAPISISNCADFARVEDTRWALHARDPCQFTWRPTPPPPDMCLSRSVDAGDRGIGRQYAEVLVLGETEEEMTDIVAMHACLSPMSLQVDYGNRPSRSIGHGFANSSTHTLDIDGRGGERVVAIFIAPPGLQGWSMRIVTNLNRQMRLGKPNYYPEVRVPPLGQPGDAAPALSGVYWLWRAGPNAYVDVSVTSIGCLTWNDHFVDPIEAPGPDEAGATNAASSD